MSYLEVEIADAVNTAEIGIFSAFRSKTDWRPHFTGQKDAIGKVSRGDY
jgi:hypothetical protein